MALLYGDDPNHGPANPKITNHWGQAYKNYDESGLDTILAYDFKGNVLSGKKQVIKDSLLIDAINAGAVNNWEVTPYRADWTTTPWNEETNLLEGNYETDNVFDALNRPTETTYPEDINHVRKVATTTYNRAGALQKLAYDGVDYIEHIAYDAKGGVIMTAYGNGIMTRSLYDRVTFRLKRVRTSSFTRSGWTFNDNAGVKEDKVFTYDLQGNIVSTHDKCTDCGLPSSPDDLTRIFTYDSIYRLLTATGRESNTQPSSDVWNDAASTPSPNAQNCRTYTQAFEYDKLGNILKKIHTAAGNSFTRRYNYQAGTNKLLTIDNNQSTPTVIASFSYDVKGSQTLCQSEKHYEWDYADRMRAFYNQTGTGVEPTVYAVYLYDGGGNRTKKLVRKQGGVWESVTYVGGSFEYHKKGTEEKNYTQIANVEIRTGSFTGDGAETTFYQLKDHLGSVGLRLNHAGSTIDREEYYPFGDSSLRTFTKKRYRYCGKEKDEESGLYYYGARYYMSWAARFISIDPLAADYVHLTPYNYAANKPINYYDIDGMQTPGEQKSGGEQETNQPNAETEDIDKTENFLIYGIDAKPKTAKIFTRLFSSVLGDINPFYYDEDTNCILFEGDQMARAENLANEAQLEFLESVCFIMENVREVDAKTISKDEVIPEIRFEQKNTLALKKIEAATIPNYENNTAKVYIADDYLKELPPLESYKIDNHKGTITKTITPQYRPFNLDELAINGGHEIGHLFERFFNRDITGDTHNIAVERFEQLILDNYVIRPAKYNKKGKMTRKPIFMGGTAPLHERENK